MFGLTRKSLVKRGLLLVLLLALLGAGSLGLANLAVVRGAQGHIAGSLEELRPAQAAIVLGAQVHEDGSLSAALADRVEAGIALYRAGKVDKLLMTGDHGQVSYDEVNSMRQYALARGVPIEDIFLDHAGFSTYDSMYRARDVFEVKSAVIVTQEYHLWRAVFIARSLGLDATGFASRNTEMPSRNYQRELLARVKALWTLYVARPGPRFLGPVIPITGDGRATNDGLS